MIKLEKYEVFGWEAAIRGMRNPMNSWAKSDSGWKDVQIDLDFFKPYNYFEYEWDFNIGSCDLNLMKKLCNAGADHRKFMRMITVYVDITAPLYWWKEFKTYRAGRKFGDDEPEIINEEYLEYDIEMNSCSTMHKIHKKEFTIDDFSHEHLDVRAIDILKNIIEALNDYRELYINYNANDFEVKGCPSKKDIWWQMIQLLPSSYNQKRTVMLNYEVLANMYRTRNKHKLDEWRALCGWIENLPYSELITKE